MKQFQLPVQQDGFTLIEVLIALTIFAFGLLGIAALQGRAMKFNAGSNTRTVTSAIAHSAMETVLTREPTDSVFRGAGFTDADLDLDPDTLGNSLTLADGRTYSGVWSVAVDSPTSGMSKVTVTITGPDGTQVSMVDFKQYVVPLP